MNLRALRVPTGVVLMLIAQLLVPAASSHPVAAQSSRPLYVYDQITDLPETTGTVGYPVLSGDGTTAVFTNAPGTGDPATPNRIYTIGADGSGMTEVDSYTSLHYSGSLVDISTDGSTVVSTEGVQLRIADDGGARELVRLAGGEISAAVITGDGQTVFFMLRRDDALAADATPMQRGVWAIDASGANLRQVVGFDDIGALFGMTPDQLGCCVHADGGPLDVSDDGGRIAFIAYGNDGEHVFSANGDGSNLVDLRGGLAYGMRVAISGDGALVAYDVTPAGAQLNEVAITPSGAASPTVLVPAMPYSGYREPFQLTQDGSQLLISSNGWLVDTATGESTLLSVPIADTGGNHEAVLTDGLPRGTMDATGKLFLYVMRTARCADCANQQEQLATLRLDPQETGQAPVIMVTKIEPGSIGLDRSSDASVSAQIAATNTVLGVGFAVLLGNVEDQNIAFGEFAVDDGQIATPATGEHVYTFAGIEHSYVQARDDDTGPRTIRISMEVEDANGLRHASAMDIGTLEVVDSAGR